MVCVFLRNNGVFCKYCVLFSNKGGKDRATQLNKLVKEPLNKYAKILGKDGDFEVHSKTLLKLKMMILLKQLMPLKNITYTFEDMDFIDLEEMNLKTEINLWKSKWIRIKDEGILINNNLICQRFINK